MEEAIHAGGDAGVRFSLGQQQGLGVTQGSSGSREKLHVPTANGVLFQPSSAATATSPTSRTGTSPPLTPPTTWAPPWSSPVTPGTPWSRAPPSSSASTCGTPTGMTQSRCAEVSPAHGPCWVWGEHPWAPAEPCPPLAPTATCGGELTAVAGVILSPNWPEPYTEGEDCIWRIHVGEEKRLFLDIQL